MTEPGTADQGGRSPVDSYLLLLTLEYFAALDPGGLAGLKCA
jgi:hypothetical protein